MAWEGTATEKCSVWKGVHPCSCESSALQLIAQHCWPRWHPAGFLQHDGLTLQREADITSGEWQRGAWVLLFCFVFCFLTLNCRKTSACSLAVVVGVCHAVVTLAIGRGCPKVSWGAALQEARACHGFPLSTWAYSMLLVFAQMGYLTLFASCCVMAVCLTCWCLFLFCSSFMRATPCQAACSLPR